MKLLIALFKFAVYAIARFFSLVLVLSCTTRYRTTYHSCRLSYLKLIYELIACSISSINKKIRQKFHNRSTYIYLDSSTPLKIPYVYRVLEPKHGFNTVHSHSISLSSAQDVWSLFT